MGTQRSTCYFISSTFSKCSVCVHHLWSVVWKWRSVFETGCSCQDADVLARGNKLCLYLEQFSETKSLFDISLCTDLQGKLLDCTTRLSDIIGVLIQAPNFTATEGGEGNRKMLGWLKQGLGMEDNIKAVVGQEHAQTLANFSETFFQAKATGIHAQLQAVVAATARSKGATLLTALDSAFGMQLVTSLQLQDRNVLERVSKYSVPPTEYQSLIDFGTKCGDTGFNAEVSFVSTLMHSAYLSSPRWNPRACVRK